MSVRYAGAVLAAVLGLAGMPVDPATGVPPLPSPTPRAAWLGGAAAEPSTGLHNGSIVMVSVTSFPPNTVLAAVQCDARVLTRGDSYCDTTYLAVGVTGPDGTGTFPFVVRTGALFDPPAANAACNAVRPCEIAVQTATEDADGELTQGLASVYFGTDTRTTLTASVRPRDTRRIRLEVEVSPVGAGLARFLIPLTGDVILRDNGRVWARRALPASGRLLVTRKFGPGRHVLRAAYTGNAEYAQSRSRRVPTTPQ